MFTLYEQKNHLISWSQCKSVQKPEFLTWPQEAGSKNESVPTDVAVKMPKLTSDINTLQPRSINSFGHYS